MTFSAPTASRQTKQLRDPGQARLVLVVEWPARSENALYDVERLLAHCRILGQHLRDCCERGFLVDQQQIELFAHQGLELYQREARRHVWFVEAAARFLRRSSLGEAAAQFQSRARRLRRDTCPRIPGLGWSPRKAANRHPCFQFGDPRAQQFLMPGVFGRPAQGQCACRIDPESGLQRGRAVNGEENLLCETVAPVAPGIQRSDDLLRHILLPADERVVRRSGAAVLAHPVCHRLEHRHHRVCIR